MPTVEPEPASKYHAGMAKKRAKQPEPASWADRCRAVREGSGLSMAAVAAKVGVSARTWYYYELGRSDPPEPVRILIGLLESGKLR